MNADQHSIGRAAALRDAAAGRIRTTTALVVALAAGLTAAFTALAASSTHPRQHVVRSPTAGHAKARPVRAPVPPLVPVRVGRAAPPATGQSATTPAPTPVQTPAPAPVQAPVTTPPVVASGGS